MIQLLVVFKKFILFYFYFITKVCFISMAFGKIIALFRILVNSTPVSCLAFDETYCGCNSIADEVAAGEIVCLGASYSNNAPQH